MSEQLKATLLSLKNTRTKLAQLQSDLADKQNQFQLDNAALIGEIDVTQQICDKFDADVRTTALSLFDGENKDIGFGVKIRIMTKLIYDEKVALSWALDHKIAVKLDAKAFENIAKTEPLDFVKTNKIPSATIPTEIILE